MASELSLRTTRIAIAILTAATLLSGGCSSSSSSTGTGGKGVGSGGSGGSGTGGRGGTTGTGGSTSAGGAIGTGGNTTIGVTVPGTGGDTGTGGAVCLTPVYTHVSAFGSIFDGWGVAMNNPSPNLTPVPAMADAGASGTKVELDPLDGSPTNGSVKLTIPFDGPGETLLFADIYNGGVNLTGTTVTAQIKLDSGLNTTPVDSGQAFLVLKSTSGYVYAAGTPVNLDSSAGWVTLSINANAPSATLPFGYMPCDIREIDVQIQSGQGGTYTTAVVHIDTISITSPDSTTTDGGSSSDATADTATPDASGG
jgi:hypothetical protein